MYAYLGMNPMCSLAENDIIIRDVTSNKIQQMAVRWNTKM